MPEIPFAVGDIVEVRLEPGHYHVKENGKRGLVGEVNAGGCLVNQFDGEKVYWFHTHLILINSETEAILVLGEGYFA